MEKLRWQFIQGHTACQVPGPAHKLNASLSNPILILSPVLLCSLGSWESPCQKRNFGRCWAEIPWYSTSSESQSDSQSFWKTPSRMLFGTISFLLILTAAPFQPPQHRSCSSCHSALTPQTPELWELPQLSAGTRPKVINPSELISSVCTLSLTPRVGISHSSGHSPAGSWHTAPWQQWPKAFVLCSSSPSPTKIILSLPSPFTPTLLSNVFWFHTWKIEPVPSGDSRILMQNFLEFVMPIYRNVIDGHIHTYCVSLLKMPENKLKQLSSLIQDSAAPQDTPTVAR